MIRFIVRSLLATLLGLASVTATVRPALAADDTIVLAGGCFWGMQAVFSSLKGVDSATAGYAGGTSAATAHYELVSTGTTGNAESVEVRYDPARISLQQLLNVYFMVAHDPTELDRQGPDDGTQYRSEIFYTTNAQRTLAQQTIAALTRRHIFTAPIVTQLAPLRGFWKAEDYHQDYLVHNTDNPYIVENDLPKLSALATKYPALVNRTSAPIVAWSKTRAN